MNLKLKALKKTLKNLIVSNSITTIIGLIMLVIVGLIWYPLGYINLETFIGFAPFPLGLIFSKDSWFKFKRKKKANEKSKK
jgi:hypothetical protein